MQTTNDRVTEEQVSDLLHLAAELQAKAEARNDRDTAVMAYAVQKVCLELTESRLTSKASEQHLAAVLAENAELKNFISTDCFVAHVEPETFYEEEVTRYVNADGYEPETPTTAAYLAEVRAQARNEGINYAASRLAAAYNHGFVDKPLAEVYDVVRMILTAKEDLANEQTPAADGLSGEYAEKSLIEFAAQLRQGSEHE